MLLAHAGAEMAEAELIRKTTLDEGGLTPEELDPLRGRRRVSIKKLAKARSLVQQWAVIPRQ
jgi:hypothetical protein